MVFFKVPFCLVEFFSSLLGCKSASTHKPKHHMSEDVYDKRIGRTQTRSSGIHDIYDAQGNRLGSIVAQWRD